jgi:hypothetical protein
MVLRILGPRRYEMTGGWRRLQNEELHSLYSSPRIIGMMKSRRMRWAGYEAQTEQMNEYRLLMGEPERKKPVGRPRHVGG